MRRAVAGRAPGCRRTLGREARTVPARGGPRIEQAVVQPGRPPLPELDGRRNHPVAAPVRRARGSDAVPQSHLGGAREQPGLAADDLALRRRPRADAARERAAAEVFVRLLLARALHGAVDANLAFELGPEEQQAGP